jgi:hypothetical protein
MEQAREALKKLNVFAAMADVPDHRPGDQAIGPPALSSRPRLSSYPWN